MWEYARDIFASAGDLALVVLGFSAIIVIHEAGHFFAARWASIRVLAFAVGFGPALISFRKGLGFRRGSSEVEYNKLRADAQGLAGPARETARDALSGKVSPTEYRLNVLPFGGYVKMLGQDDADPGASSNDPDSYQNCRPWKRMVVISAGVVFNIITAAILFVIVFNPHVGLLEETPRIGGVADPECPAAVAVATNAAQLGVTAPGLKPGDTIVSVNGEKPSHFNDFSLAIAMTHRSTADKLRGEPVAIDVQRTGVNGVLHFSIAPRYDRVTKFFSIGALHMADDHVVSGSRRVRADIQKGLNARGYKELRPGMRLVLVQGKPVASPYDLDEAVERSGGKPVSATFQTDGNGGSPASAPVTIELTPRPALLTAEVETRIGSESVTVHPRHLLGLMPLLAVGVVEEGSQAMKGGIQEGDIFARLGNNEWPSVPAGLAIIGACIDADIHVVVYRQVSRGVWEERDLRNIRTTSQGKLGFQPLDSTYLSNFVAAWPKEATGPTPSGSSLPGIKNGSRIVAANGTPVATLGDLRNALKQITSSGGPATVTLTIRPPSGGPGTPEHPTQEVAWPLSADDAAALSRLGWENPFDIGILFDHERFVWKSETFAGAIPKGLHETNRVMMNTYLTFARLFQGSVKVEHLKGPVGIAHVGVAIADKGPIWLLFFLALISVNLAVINFLPMPIADGGHMVFLIYEQLTGRPPSARFQNAAAISGLVVLGTLFLVVTFNDVSHVFTDLKRFFGG